MRRIGIAVVLLGLACAGVGAQADVTDLAVGNLHIQGSGPQWVQGSAHDGLVAFEVVNHGAALTMYRVDLSWKDQRGTVPLNGNESSSFDVSRQPLAAGSARSHTFPWRLQSGQVGPGTVIVTVSPAEGLDARPADNQATTAFDVPAHRLALAVDGQDLLLQPGGTGFFRLSLRNDGNRLEQVALAFAPSNQDPRPQTRLTQTRVDVPPGSIQDTHLLVKFEPGGDFSPLGLNYTVSASAHPIEVLRIDTPQVRDGPAKPLEGYQAQLQGPQDDLRIPRGMPTAIGLQVTNTGTHPDNYTFASAIDAGWSVQVTPPDLCLRPGETRSVIARVSPPPQADPGASGTLSLDLRGSMVANASHVIALLRVGGPAPQVNVLEVDPVYVGKPVTLRAVLQNAGDAPLPATPVRFTWTQGGLTQQVVLDVDALPPGSTVEARAALPPPIAGGPMEVAAKWPSDRPPSMSRVLLAHAPAFLVLPPAPLNASAGETVAYRLPPNVFRIENVGNAPETVTLSGSASFGEVLLETGSFTLAPGENRSAPLSLRVPAPTGATKESLVWLEVRVPGINGTWGGSVATRLVDKDAPILEPLPVPRQWPVGAPLDLVAVVTESGEVAWVRAELDAPEGSNRSISLFPYQDTWRAATTLDQEGTYRVSFKAADRAGHNVSAAPQTIEAVAPRPTVLTWLTPASSVPPGVSLDIEVDSQVPVVEILVSMIQGTTITNQSVPVEGARASVVLAAVGPGPVTLVASATDWRGQTMQANTTLHVVVPLTLSSEASSTSQAAQPAPTAMIGCVVALLLVALARRRMHE